MAEPASVDMWSKGVAFIREFGLPSFLVVWFLFRFEKKLEQFTNTLHKLITMNVVMLKTLDKDDEAQSLLDSGDEESASKNKGKKKPKPKASEGD